MMRDSMTVGDVLFESHVHGIMTDEIFPIVLYGDLV